MEGQLSTPIPARVKRLARRTHLLDEIRVEIPHNEAIIDVFVHSSPTDELFLLFFVGLMLTWFFAPLVIVFSISSNISMDTRNGTVLAGIIVTSINQAIFWPYAKLHLRKNKWKYFKFIIIVITNKAVHEVETSTIYIDSSSKQFYTKQFTHNTHPWSKFSDPFLEVIGKDLFISDLSKSSGVKISRAASATEIVQSVLVQRYVETIDRDEKEKREHHTISQAALNKYREKCTTHIKWIAGLSIVCGLLCGIAAFTRFSRVYTGSEEHPTFLPFDNLDIFVMVAGGILFLIIITGIAALNDIRRVGKFFNNHLPLGEKSVVVGDDGVRYPSKDGEVVIKFEPGWLLMPKNSASDSFSSKFDMIEYHAIKDKKRQGFLGPVKSIKPFFRDFKDHYFKFLIDNGHVIPEEVIAKSCYAAEPFKVALIEAMAANMEKHVEVEGTKKRNKARKARAGKGSYEREYILNKTRDPSMIEPIDAEHARFHGTLKGLVKHYLDPGEEILLVYRHPAPAIALLKKPVLLALALLIAPAVILMALMTSAALYFNFWFTIPMLFIGSLWPVKELPLVSYLSRAEFGFTTSKILASVGSQFHIIQYSDIKEIYQVLSPVKGYFDLKVDWHKGAESVKKLRFPYVKVDSDLVAVLLKVGLMKKT
nr:hypothetical protein [Candidatus Sigynarchaeota archaeon]